MKLWKTNGSLWLTQYLSETCRIIVLWVNKAEYVRSTTGIRVRLTRSGLPVLLPGALRRLFHQLNGEDHAYALKVIRVTLTVLSVYRVIGCAPNLKLETITGPFSGESATLLAFEVSQVVGWLPRTLVIGRALWTHMSEAAGPNAKKSTWSCGLDALAFLRDPQTWYHWMMCAWASKSWDVIAWLLLTMLACLPIVPILAIKGMLPKRLGRLVTLFEARGKVRVVAITDWWTQVILKPLHEGIFDILRDIPQDGTFDQLGPVEVLIAYVRASGAKVYSFDLSAATDRLPVAFQIQVLEALGVSWARNWAALLTGRAWVLKDKPYRYSVGQPMGALSSWAMLALSHHIIVQIAAHRVGETGWFAHYALLGDDIVIADEAVARSYKAIMETLGVPINITKSFVMESGGLEFAKRWITPNLGDISPISPGLLLSALRNPRMMASLTLDCLERGYVFSTRVIVDLENFLRKIRPRKWMDRQWEAILSTVVGPLGGLWDTASGPLFEAVWIGLFPHHMVNKLGELVDTLFQLRADSQKPPLSEEESMGTLASNFWKRAWPTGRFCWGAIWAPLLVISPAFWVYYDLASRAEERCAEFRAKVNAFDQARWGGFIGDFFEDYNRDRVAPLNSLIKSTFDPNLLDWTRKLAEDNLRLHIELYHAWAERARLADLHEDLARHATAARLAHIEALSRTPTNLSLVPLNYFYWERHHILLRPIEVPQGYSDFL